MKISDIIKKKSRFSPNSLGKQSYEVFSNKRVNPIAYVQLDNRYLPKETDPEYVNYIVTEQLQEILITELETNPGQEQQLIVEVPINLSTQLGDILITENDNFIID